MSKNELKLSERVRERLLRDFPPERKLNEFRELVHPECAIHVIECEREPLEKSLVGVRWIDIGRRYLSRVYFLLSLLNASSFSLFLPGFLCAATQALDNVEPDGDLLEVVLVRFLEGPYWTPSSLVKEHLTAQQRVAVDEALSIIENASLDYELMDVEKLPGLMQVVQTRLRAEV